MLLCEFIYTPLEDVPSNHFSHGKGGVVLVWRKSLDSLISRLDVDSDRNLGTVSDKFMQLISAT